MNALLPLDYITGATPCADPFYEYIFDFFAGGGGASTGIEMALGRSPDFAINHDPEALALHEANHPETTHLQRNVWKVDPFELIGNKPVGLCWFSPDCKHFSKAKGGKPRKREIRDLAWVVVQTARRVRPRVIILENVEEFREWGPLTPEGQPCKERKGETFKRWKGELQRLGYKIEWRELRACDYGAPTIRKRFFMIARRDGKPITWPLPTHGAPNDPDVIAGKKLPWRTAAEIIDWSLPCHSIFLSLEEARVAGVNRPLAEATMARIAKGVYRYVLNAKPFIVTLNHQGEHFRGQDLGEPFKTVTSSRDAHGLVVPHIEAAQQGGSMRAADAPLHTITASRKDQNLVVGASLVGVGGRAAQSRPRGVDEPTATQTAKPDAVLVAAHVTKFNTGAVGLGCGEPLSTLTTAHSDYHPGGALPVGVVSAFLAQHSAGSHPGRQARGADEPLSTVTQKGSQQAVVSAGILNQKGSDQRMADPSKPTPTVCAQGTHIGEVRAFLVKYYDTAVGQAVSEPLHTATAKPRFGLVTVEGEDYLIADIGMRMLSPRELYRAQGFPDSYKIEIEYGGKPLPKSSQTRMCGNSVCPPLAKALVEANCMDLAKVEEVA